MPTNPNTLDRQSPPLTLHRGGFIPQGVTQQGRLQPTIQPKAAEASTELGADTEDAGRDLSSGWVWWLKVLWAPALLLAVIVGALGWRAGWFA